MDNAIHSNDITDGSSFDNFDSEAIIKAIGVGGGGGNAVNYTYRRTSPTSTSS